MLTLDELSRACRIPAESSFCGPDSSDNTTTVSEAVDILLDDIAAANPCVADLTNGDAVGPALNDLQARICGEESSSDGARQLWSTATVSLCATSCERGAGSKQVYPSSYQHTGRSSSSASSPVVVALVKSEGKFRKAYLTELLHPTCPPSCPPPPLRLPTNPAGPSSTSDARQCL